MNKQSTASINDLQEYTNNTAHFNCGILINDSIKYICGNVGPAKSVQMRICSDWPGP